MEKRSNSRAVFVSRVDQIVSEQYKLFMKDKITAREMIFQLNRVTNDEGLDWVKVYNKLSGLMNPSGEM